MRDEVIYHSVKIFDLYLSISENMDEFEYIGAAAMLIAAKSDVRFRKFLFMSYEQERKLP